jgi:hypothetical protein
LGKLGDEICEELIKNAGEENLEKIDMQLAKKLVF